VGEYEVFADPMITKVFFNIGSNVNRHAQASNLFITTREENGLLLLSFADDGIGIGKKDRLFTRGSSFGYGLFLSKEILAITGISIKEVGIPGKGATFEMTFPQDRFRHTPVRQYMSRITV
jgi:signal transduction histidine kinase